MECTYVCIFENIFQKFDADLANSFGDINVFIRTSSNTLIAFYAKRCFDGRGGKLLRTVLTDPLEIYT